jgi:hypothetical protein
MISATNYLVTVYAERKEVLAVANLIEPRGHEFKTSIHKRIRYISSNWHKFITFPSVKARVPRPAMTVFLPPSRALSYRSPDAIQQMTASIPPARPEALALKENTDHPAYVDKIPLLPLAVDEHLVQKAATSLQALIWRELEMVADESKTYLRGTRQTHGNVERST